MKKLISLLLVLVLCIGNFASFTVSADPLTEKDLDITWIDAEFNRIADFNDGFAIVENAKEDKFGIINDKGELITDIKYDFVDLFIDGMARVQIQDDDKGRLYGFVDENGVEVIPCEYNNLSNFNNGIAYYRTEDGERAYINKKGKKVEPDFVKKVEKVEKKLSKKDKFFGAEYMFDDLIRVNIDDKYGVVDMDGNEVVPCEYDGVDDVFEGFIKVYNGKWGQRKYGLIDTKGNVILSCEYPILKYGYGKYKNGSHTNSFSDEYIRVSNASLDEDYHAADKVGLYDRKGNKIIDHKFNWIQSFSDEGYAVARIGYGSNYKCKVIDKSGQIMGDIPMNAGAYSEDLIGTSKIENGKWLGRGYIDINGNEVIKFGTFDMVSPFYNGLAFVQKDGKWGILKNPLTNKKNEVKTPVSQEEPQPNTAVNKVTATPSQQNLTVNGKKIDNLEIYAINGYNYFKLRDIASLANNTESKFSVGWKAEKNLISLETKKAYQEVGTELKAGDNLEKEAIKSNVKVEVNGKEVAFDAYLINNQTYYKLRDLGKALDFGVNWDNATQTMLVEM